MATAKLQKPNNEACSKAHEEHKISHKISEMTAWGTKVFGHKQPEHQAVAKHCNTCQCAPPKELKPTVIETNKKEHTATVSPCKDAKKEKKEEQAGRVNKDTKHHTWLEFKKKEKQHATNPVIRDQKQASCTETKKEMKEHHAKSTATNACNTMTKKGHKGEPTNHCFSSVADHWKEKITMMKKAKDDKSKYSSDSSSSDSEDETCDKKKKEKRYQHHRTKATSN